MNQKDILFIGLGGHAGRIVTGIKKELSQYQKSHNLHYLLIDLERYHNLENGHIDENEYLFFGGINPKQYVNDIINEGINSDNFIKLNTYFPIDQSFFIETLPNRPIEKGAGRKRMIGRLLLYSKKQHVENKVNELIRKLDPKDDNSQPNVVVISSSCGGTGSSIFYDILNLFSSPSINLYPIVIGPSMLVEKNKEVNIQLANKIKINAMAFFEELNFYNRFPKYNFSFFSNNATSLNLRYVIFFDNLLNETSRIAENKLKDFEDYISKCTSLLFNGEYKDDKNEVTQDVWANIENISDDMLNELKEIESNAVSGLLEQNNYISFGYPRTQNISAKQTKDSQLLDILKTLINTNGIENHNKIDKDDILRTIEPGLFKEFSKTAEPWKKLVGVFNRLNAQDIKSKYVHDLVSDSTTPERLNEIDKIITLESIKDYLIEINSKIPDEDAIINEDSSIDTDETENPTSFISRVWDGFTGFIRRQSNESTENDDIEDTNTQKDNFF